ncbi:ABC transporter ATP-binding protein [soil metagenome]
MAKPTKSGVDKKSAGPGIFSVLKPYKSRILLLVFLAFLGNGVNLILPKIIASAIDSYPSNYILSKVMFSYIGASLVVFVFTWMQGIVQVYASEKVARDLRTTLSQKISRQSSVYIEASNPSKLLTNLTSDVDSIKMFVSQAIVSIASSVFIIIGACILLFITNWKLAFSVIAIIPIIGGAFAFVLKKVRPLFIKNRQVIDRLNKVINESIMAAAIIRVINSQQPEYVKFVDANTQSKNLGMQVLKMFATLIPVIIFTANLGGLAILTFGGRFVISDTMTLGDFAAFNSYLSMLIFPILVIGFMSGMIAQASASHVRITGLLHEPDPVDTSTIKQLLKGNVNVQNISMVYGEKTALTGISFSVPAGSSLAVIGPTAAGKTQLLYLLTGLLKPTDGRVSYDGADIEAYDKENFYSQVGFVFQDSILFNMSIRENIAFNKTATDESLQKAIATAELKDFIENLPDKLDTIVSERGTSLSGGQKQRLMLARALANNPRVLLLDDFTARVDTNTETRILSNLQRNYPGITLISVTQKIATAASFDQIIVLMQGEIVARGIHETLLKESPEYVQIFNSQQSISNYEVQSQ